MLDIVFAYLGLGLLAVGIKVIFGNFSRDKDDITRTVDGGIENVWKKIEKETGRRSKIYKDAIIFVSFIFCVLIWPVVALDIFFQLGQIVSKGRK